MATKIYIIDSNQAQYTDEEFSAIQSELYSEGVFNVNGTNDDLLVTENTTPDLSVLINTGGVLISYLKNAITWKVIGKSNAVENLAVNPNTSGSNRVDAVIAHFNQDEPNELKNNVFELLVIEGSGTSPLSDGDIDTAVGDTNWYRLADVTVPNGASQILDANISDTRLAISIGINEGGYRSRYIGDGSSLFGILKNPLDSSILADTDIAYDIGAPTERFRNLYTENEYSDFFHGDGRFLTNVPTSGLEIQATLGEDYPANDIMVIDQSSGTTLRQVYGASYIVGQTFTIPTGMSEIHRLDLALGKNGNPTPNDEDIICEIWTESAGFPDTLIATADARKVYEVTSGASGGEWCRFLFSTPVAVTAGTQYVIVVRCAAGTSTNYIRSYWINADIYPGGNYIYSINGGTSWTATTGDMKFRVFGDNNIQYPFYIDDGNYSDVVIAEQTNQSSYYQIYTTNFTAQIFDSYDFNWLSSFRVYIYRQGSPGNIPVNFEIQSVDANGDPTGTVLFSDSLIANTEITTSPAYYKFNAGIALTPNTKYALVITMPSGGNAANNIRWYYRVTDTTIPNGYAATTGGAGWNKLSTADMTCTFNGQQQRVAGSAYRVQPGHIDRHLPAGIPPNTTPISAGNPITLRVMGTVVGWSGLTTGQDYWLDVNGTSLRTSPPLILQGTTEGFPISDSRGAEVFIGQAVSPTTINLNLNKPSQVIAQITSISFPAGVLNYTIPTPKNTAAIRAVGRTPWTSTSIYGGGDLFVDGVSKIYSEVREVGNISAMATISLNWNLGSSHLFNVSTAGTGANAQYITYYRK